MPKISRHLTGARSYICPIMSNQVQKNLVNSHKSLAKRKAISYNKQ